MAGAGNVAMGAGRRATAKALGNPPDPKVGAPVFDPTWGGKGPRGPQPTRSRYMDDFLAIVGGFAKHRFED